MRQLIARIDDKLHARLKAKAKAEGRTLNAVVTEALESSVHAAADRDAVLRRLDTSGWRVIPPRPSKVPRSQTVDELTRGVGTAVTDALLDERAAR